MALDRLWIGWEFKKMRKRVKNTVFFRNLSEDSSADASADAPAIINIG